MKYNKEEKTKKIFELNERGLKPKEIAAVMHITEQYVRRILNRGYPIPTIKNNNLNASTPVLSPYELQINPPYETRVSGDMSYPIQPSPDASLLRKNEQLQKKIIELERRLTQARDERDKVKGDSDNQSRAFSQKENECEELNRYCTKLENELNKEIQYRISREEKHKKTLKTIDEKVTSILDRLISRIEKEDALLYELIDYIKTKNERKGGQNSKQTYIYYRS